MKSFVDSRHARSGCSGEANSFFPGRFASSGYREAGGDDDKSSKLKRDWRRNEMKDSFVLDAGDDAVESGDSTCDTDSSRVRLDGVK